jgi:hypothetical protein
VTSSDLPAGPPAGADSLPDLFREVCRLADEVAARITDVEVKERLTHVLDGALVDREVLEPVEGLMAAAGGGTRSETGADHSDVATGAPGGRHADYLLDLALSRPTAALAQARELLAHRPGAAEASIAHQAVGIALRDVGHLHDGIAELRRALRASRASGRPQREADVPATLA